MPKSPYSSDRNLRMVKMILSILLSFFCIAVIAYVMIIFWRIEFFGFWFKVLLELLCSLAIIAVLAIIIGYLSSI